MNLLIPLFPKLNREREGDPQWMKITELCFNALKCSCTEKCTIQGCFWFYGIVSFDKMMCVLCCYELVSYLAYKIQVDLFSMDICSLTSIHQINWFENNLYLFLVFYVLILQCCFLNFITASLWYFSFISIF